MDYIYFVNLIASILLILGSVFVLYIVIKRNKKIVVKGSDDIFTISLIMLFVVVIFQITEKITLMEIVRNICIYTFLFSTFCIRRGICEGGFAKVFFTVPWEKIKEVQVSATQTTRFQVVCFTEKYHFKLMFRNIQLKRVMWELDKYSKNIKIEQSLQELIIKGKK